MAQCHWFQASPLHEVVLITGDQFTDCKKKYSGTKKNTSNNKSTLSTTLLRSSSLKVGSSKAWRLMNNQHQKKLKKKLTQNKCFLTFIFMYLTQQLIYQLINGLMLVRNLPMLSLVKIVRLHPPPLHHIFLNLYIYLPLFVIYKYYVSK